MKKTLVNYYLLLTLLFSALVIILMCGLYIKTQEDIFTQNTKELRNKILENYKSELQNRVNIIEQYIDYKKSTSDERLRSGVMQKVYEAYDLAETLYLENKETMSEENIKKLIIQTLRNMHFNNGRGYYFIDTLEGKCVLYPIKSEDEGKDVLHYQDFNGKYTVQEFITIATEKKEGFSEYYTRQPNKHKEKTSYQKIAFVKLFERFNWVIGTGEYVADVEEDIKKEIASEITHYRTAKNESYVTIFEILDFQGGENAGVVIVNPTQNDNNGIYGPKISTNIKDIDGFYYRKEALNQLNQNGEGFVTYKAEKMNSTEISPKITYFKLLKHWNWSVATAKQLDELDSSIKDNERKIQEQVQANIEYALILFMIVFALLLIFSFYISKKIKKDMQTITQFFALASSDKREIDASQISIEEFKQLSFYANKMIKEIQTQHEYLESINENLEYKVYEKTKELQNLNFSLETKNKELEKNYFTDILTKLPNRNKFTKDLTFVSFPQVFLLDIDGFKHINDFYGTVVGDILLVEFSEFVKAFAQKYEMNIYRLGSDQFLLLCDKIFEKEFMEAILKEIALELGTRFFYKNNKDIKLQINLTCGVAIGKSNLLEKADIALNFAKKKKLPHALFQEENPLMNTHKQNIYWQQKIQHAIQNDGIVAYYQEIVNIQNPNKIKYECLMRLLDDDKAISPYLFLEVAKETRLYYELTRIMIQKTFEKFAHNDYDFSLNISLLDIENRVTVEFLTEQIQAYGIGERLILELLESEDIMSSSIFLPFVESLKKLGVRFALDDFGSGYSNFSFVLKIEPSFLKIDGSLIKNIINDKNAYNVVQTIVALAGEINAEIIAEFVENEEIVNVLKELGIYLMQGYHFSIPAPDIKA